ncbi:hypothetical protein, partial [Glutamicibacter sp. BW78]|uniref:hypothetical protein n=1 Tax=Glutamicibacter sp. BW78 TaxID=2024403 RepID=UPI001A7E134E
MPSDIWVPITVAVIGSGALSTIISLLIQRFSFDRKSKIESQYASDLKLLQDLEKAASKGPEGKLVRAVMKSRLREDL